MWKGTDSLGKTKNAIEKYITTPFKEIKLQSGVKTPTLAKRTSVYIGPTSSLMKRESNAKFERINTGGVGANKFQKEDVINDIHEVLTPIYTGKANINDDATFMANIRPKVSSDECLVSIRSIIAPDNEPNFFTTLFSGSMLVRSFDFLEYGKDDEYGYVMLYQLIGVPHVNQKAVEVPVKWESLSSTGLYVLMADDNLFFWIGTLYYSKYLNIKTYNNENYLLSDQLLKKLNYIYEEEATEIINDEKTLYFILENLETELFQKIMTKDDELDLDMPDYESKLIRKHLKLPQEPRFFCLCERGIIPDYKEVLIDEKRHSIENENYVFKEYLNYDQLTFMQKGIYLLKFRSDNFVWIGSKVEESDLQTVLLDLSHKVSDSQNIHIIHENYEPSIFIELFQTWKSRMTVMLTKHKNSMDEINEEDEGESKSSSSSSKTSTIMNEDEDDEVLMKEIEIETKSYTRILPMDLWKKIVYS